ncbi:hypothetical protein THAOC_11784, partial [Thalassiosira oceanica]
ASEVHDEHAARADVPPDAGDVVGDAVAQAEVGPEEVDGPVVRVGEVRREGVEGVAPEELDVAVQGQYPGHSLQEEGRGVACPYLHDPPSLDEPRQRVQQRPGVLHAHVRVVKTRRRAQEPTREDRRALQERVADGAVVLEQPRLLRAPVRLVGHPLEQDVGPYHVLGPPGRDRGSLVEGPHPPRAGHGVLAHALGEHQGRAGAGPDRRDDLAAFQDGQAAGHVARVLVTGVEVQIRRAPVAPVAAAVVVEGAPAGGEAGVDVRAEALEPAGGVAVHAEAPVDPTEGVRRAFLPYALAGEAPLRLRHGPDVDVRPDRPEHRLRRPFRHDYLHCAVPVLPRVEAAEAEAVAEPDDVLAGRRRQRVLDHEGIARAEDAAESPCGGATRPPSAPRPPRRRRPR